MFKERMFLRRRASGMLLSIMMTYFLYQIIWIKERVIWLQGVIAGGINKSGIDWLQELLPLIAISIAALLINVVLYNTVIKRLNFRMDDKGGVDNQIEELLGGVFITLYFFYVLYFSFKNLFFVASDNTTVNTILNFFKTLFAESTPWNFLWICFPIVYIVIINWTNNVISEKMKQASNGVSVHADIGHISKK